MHAARSTSMRDRAQSRINSMAGHIRHHEDSPQENRSQWASEKVEGQIKIKNGTRNPIKLPNVSLVYELNKLAPTAKLIEVLGSLVTVRNIKSLIIFIICK